VDDDPVGVFGDQRWRERPGVWVGQVAGEIVLYDERPVLACDPPDVVPPLRGEADAGRVLEEGLDHHDAGAGVGERFVEVVGAHAFGVERYGDSAQPCGVRRCRGAWVGG